MMTGHLVHDVVHRRTVAVDALVALLALCAFAMAATKDGQGYWTHDQQTWPVVALEALIFLSLVMRRTWPMPVLVITSTGCAVLAFVISGAPDSVGAPIAVPAVLVVHTIARRAERRTAVQVALAVGVLLVAGGAVRSGEWLSTENISVLAWTGFAAALGQAIQSQKAYVAAVEERARRAEQTREEEGQRRVIEERLRIARELHDVVAHHIAVIQVQAGVVDHMLTERPVAAREALGHVRRASKMVLDELSGMLDVLRQPDEPITPTDPAPGLDRLLSLIEQFAASGLKVDWRITGTPVPLPSAVDLVAYRLVQEGLTNAHKHGSGTAEMVLGFEPAGLMIEIVNRVAVPVGGPASGSAATTTGHGLAGMRERSHAVGGTVSVSDDRDGVWRVTARVPFDTEGDESSACRWGAGT
jgi:signal transduction histidine kinase